MKKCLRVALAVALAIAVAGAVVVPSADASGYLTTARAKRIARDRAWDFNSRIDRVHIDWYNRWSGSEVHLGVTGSWGDGSECDATIEVWKNRYGHVRSRVRDKSCFYG